VTVNTSRYVAMIRDFLVPALRRRRLNRFRIWSQQDGATAKLPGKRWPNYGSCFLGSSSPIEVMCCGPPALRTCQLAILFVRIPKRKSVRRQATRYSSVEECNWDGIARHTSPNMWAGVHQLLSAAERVRQKPGSSFKRRYFSYLSMFWNIRMVFLICYITCVY